MLKHILICAVLSAQPSLADQMSEAQDLTQRFRMTVIPDAAVIDVSQRHYQMIPTVFECTLHQMHRTYDPQKMVVRFADSQIHVGNIVFEPHKYRFSPRADGNNFARIDIRMFTPTAEHRTQQHPIDAQAPDWRPRIDAWDDPNTFGLTTFIFEGAFTEQDIQQLITALERYQNAYCN